MYKQADCADRTHTCWASNWVVGQFEFDGAFFLFSLAIKEIPLARFAPRERVVLRPSVFKATASRLASDGARRADWLWPRYFLG